jgi:transposase
MRKLEVKNHISLEELKVILNKEKDIRLFRYWHLLYYISIVKGLKVKDYSNRLGLGKYNIYRIVQLYNKTGKDFVNHLQWGGKRKFSLEQEKDIIRKLKRNNNLSRMSLLKVLQKELGIKLSKNYLDELIERHNLEPLPYEINKKVAALKREKKKKAKR